MVMFPVVALILSTLFEGLALTATTIIGTALVLAGNVFVLETRSAPPPREKKPDDGEPRRVSLVR